MLLLPFLSIVMSFLLITGIEKVGVKSNQVESQLKLFIFRSDLTRE
jgi:hypothetical protein